LKINIAIAGGPCTGKSTLAAALFSRLKSLGFDYDLVTEEKRKLQKEFGKFRSPFERFYMWRQQEREELRSTASNGFITDTPLFHFYVQSRQYASEERDELAVRELFRMCLEIKNRYQLITIAQDPCEFPYMSDEVRIVNKEIAITRHNLVRSFIEHFWPEKLFAVNGTNDERISQVIEKLKEMRR